MKKISKAYIGVDISKKYLDIYIYPFDKFLKIENSEAAIKRLIKELAKYDIAQIACEATGGY
jgi:transposase